MSPTVRLMVPGDLIFANAVREQAGWNQTPQDWQALLDFSQALCFVAEGDARPMGTVSVIPYGNCLALDREVFGCDREEWLRVLSQRPHVVSGENMMRPGAKAWYLGPLVARDHDASTDIVERLLPVACGGKVFWDDPDHAAISPAEWGVVRQRPLCQMIRGKALAQDLSKMIAIADSATA